jgi:hypothetical protein
LHIRTKKPQEAKKKKKKRPGKKGKRQSKDLSIAHPSKEEN